MYVVRLLVENVSMATVSEGKPFQFTLWYAGVVTFWLCICLALIVQLQELGVLIAIVVACGHMFYWAWRSGFTMLAEIAAVILIILFLVGMLLPTVDSNPGPPARRSMCANNLKQLSLALHMYHDFYGSFPPAYIADVSGRPMHSWRVLILPFLEEQDLYKLYNFNEPWDGPNNRKLADKISRVYACPSDTKPSDTKPKSMETSYVAVVGPGTVWPGERSVKTREIIDGTSNTILIVEVQNSGIHWMEPRDLHVTQMPMVINADRGQGISSLHNNGGQVALVDGSVRFINNDLDPNTLRAMLTIAGGEKVTLP